MFRKILFFLKNWLRIVWQTVCCDLIIILFACIVLYARGNRFAVVVSGSMEPAIQTGSLCVYNTNVSYFNVDVGDVVVFTRQQDDIPICHRAISVTEGGIETKGDSNNISDGISTTEDNFGGILWMAIPGAGYAVSFIQDSNVQPLVGFLLLLVLIVSSFSRIREKKGTSQEAATKTIREGVGEDEQEISAPLISVFDSKKEARRKIRKYRRLHTKTHQRKVQKSIIL